MLEEDRPGLEEYDDSLWAIEHEYGTQDGHEVVRQFTDLRCSLVERLRDLDDDEWQRTAVLPSGGEITLMWLMGNLTRQDASIWTKYGRRWGNGLGAGRAIILFGVAPRSVGGWSRAGGPARCGDEQETFQARGQVACAWDPDTLMSMHR
jgi:hypothetical protein